MVPPPSQQGKFKPRKPAKKISTAGPSTAGGTTSSDAAASRGTATGASTVAFAASSTGETTAAPAESSKSRSGPGGRGGRGDGRGGRGRGRAPIPSGRVFFSGSTEPSSSASKRRSFGGPSSSSGTSSKASGGGTSADTPKSSTKEMETTEEVVGQLETGIGATTDGRTSSGDGPTSNQASASAMDYDRKEEGGSEAAVKGSFAFDAFMYDSDSSREDDPEYNRRGQPLTIRPLELPFPSQPLPLGVGCSSRPVAYESVTSYIEANAKGVVGTIHQELPEPIMSPFVDASDSQKLAWEQDSWFLVQLPTRLPPLQPTTTNHPPTVLSSDDTIENTETNESIRQTAPFSDVVTPPVTSKSHDHVLTSTAAGRIGKIIVYKSGRTVLRMEGPEGTEPIIMQVSEGLSCGFHQEAVVIDQETARFIALGNVNKSIVITPDLSSAVAAD